MSSKDTPKAETIEKGQQSNTKSGSEDHEATVISWDDDPANARNWSKFQRIRHTLIPGERFQLTWQNANILSGMFLRCKDRKLDIRPRNQRSTP